MAKRKTKLTMSGSIRQVLVDSEYSLNAIAGETGVSQPQLSRFVNGERGLSVGSLDILCDFLGLELRPTENTK
ncbi:MAG: helix-turn-helix transcriptional regulator [Fuerstiella sp.]|jgi:transcriptional regulator with XRE-family HTH domain|nr:helix-turn-helix transcriptional regulator [Fuerstiella sp.]